MGLAAAMIRAGSCGSGESDAEKSLSLRPSLHRAVRRPPGCGGAHTSYLAAWPAVGF
jgi:hypothetical protein